MTVKITRTDFDATGLREAATRTNDSHAARRMLALALVLDGHKRCDAAKQCGMDRQTLRDWVHRYNEGGLEGLFNRPHPGFPERRLLTPEQKSVLAEIVVKGPNVETDGVVRWRRVDLQRVLHERFSVKMHERSVGKLLHSLDFRHVSARPRHPQANVEAQQTHKKTSTSW
jgi:transposase